MPQVFNDDIRLNFEVNAKGTDKLSQIAKDLDTLEKSLRKLQAMGVLLGKEFEEPITKANKDIQEARGLWQDLTAKVQTFLSTGQGLTVFGENIGKLGGKITLFATLTAAVVKTLGYLGGIIKSVSDLEVAMARVGTATRLTEGNFSQTMFNIRREVLEVSRDLNRSFSEISIVAYAMGSAGLNAAQQIAAIRPVANLVVGTLGQMEPTAKIVAGAFNLYGSSIKNASTDTEKFRVITDLIADTFAREQIELSELEAGLSQVVNAAVILNVSFEDLVNTLGFLNTGMLKGSRAGTALLNALIDISKNSGKLKTTFGIAFDPTQPLDFNHVMLELSKTIQAQGGITTEKYKQLMDVFNIRGARAVAQIIADWKRYQEALGHSADSTKGMAELLARIQSDTLSGNFQKMTNSLGESLVLLNDIVPVTRILSLIFAGIALSAKAINSVLSGVAQGTRSVWGAFDQTKETAKLSVLESNLKNVEERMKFTKSQPLSSGVKDPILKGLEAKRKALADEIEAQKNYLKILQTNPKGEQADPASISSMGVKGVVDTNKLPEEVKKYGRQFNVEIQAGKLALDFRNGDLKKEVYETNALLDALNERVQKSTSLSAETKREFAAQKLVMGENLNVSKAQIDALVRVVSFASKHVASEEEVQAVLQKVSKTLGQIAQRRKELTDMEAEGLLKAKHRLQTEESQARNLKDAVVARQKTSQALEDFNQATQKSLTLEELRKKTQKEILLLGGENKKALELALKMIEAINDETLAGLKETEQKSQYAHTRALERLHNEQEARSALLKAQGADSREMTAAEISGLQKQLAALKALKAERDAKGVKTDDLQTQIDKGQDELDQKLQAQNTLIAIEERRKVLAEGYKYLLEGVLDDNDTEVEQTQKKIVLFQQILKLSETDANAKLMLNNLKSEGVSYDQLQLELLRAQQKEARALAKVVNDGVKESLYDSLTSAKGLDEALSNVGDTIGKIVLKKQFDNLMDSLLEAFNVGGVTIDSQMKQGGTSFVSTLEVALPPLFSRMGAVFSQSATLNLQPGGGGTTGTGFSVQAPSATGSGGNGLVNSGSAPASKSADFMTTAGNIFSGAMTGTALANARNRDQTSQIMAGVGGAIGNMIVPGIGGLVGGFLGSLFGGDKHEEKPAFQEVAFRLELSNSILKDINRNLTAIREDSTAFSLQNSFYFSASQARGPGNVVFEGDFHINAADIAGLSAQDVGEAILQKISEERVRGIA